MIIKNFSKKEFDGMEKLSTSKTVNTEAELYLLLQKENWRKKYKLFKKFYIYLYNLIYLSIYISIMKLF